MKRYSMVLEVALIGPAVTGAALGGIVGLVKKQEDAIKTAMLNYQSTGNEKYKIRADKLREMTPTQFRLYALRRGAVTGAVANTAGNIAIHAVSDIGKSHIKSNKVANSLTSAATFGTIGAIRGLSLNQSALADRFDKKYQKTNKESYKQMADKIRSMPPLKFKVWAMSNRALIGGVIGSVMGSQNGGKRL